MVLMSLKVDPKLVGVAAIILGLFLGFYIDNTILSSPKIEALTTQTIEQETNIEKLEGNLTKLQSEYSTLDALYTQLNENNVPLNVHQTLQDEIQTLRSHISELDTQIENISLEVDELEDDLSSLTQDYEDLTTSNEQLQEKYNEIYNPGYVVYTLNDYSINLTVSKIDFEGNNVPITGSMTIINSNGSPFEGTFKVKISKIYQNVGSTSDSHEIFGGTNYYWPGAFVSGAGSYKLSATDIIDSEGTPVIPNYLLGLHFIKITMG